MSANPKPGRVPAEVLTYLLQRKVRGSWSHEDVWNTEHAAAFVVAKAAEESVVESIKRAVTEAVENGTPFEEFAANIQPILEKQGWWGKQSRVNPLTGEEEDVQLGSPARLKLIYQTNIRQSRAAGQWSRIQRSKAVLPKLRYRHGHPERPRPDHLAWDGITLPVDDPWWDIHYPQNGFGCQCWVEQVGAHAPTTPEEGVDRELIEVENKRTGQRVQTAKGVDPSFAYNVGKTRMAGLKVEPVKVEPVKVEPVKVDQPLPAPAPIANTRAVVDRRLSTAGKALDAAEHSIVREEISRVISDHIPGAKRSGNHVMDIGEGADADLRALNAHGSRTPSGTVAVTSSKATQIKAGKPDLEAWSAAHEAQLDGLIRQQSSLRKAIGDATKRSEKNKLIKQKEAVEVEIYALYQHKDADLTWRGAMRTLVHEELHSHGPLGTDGSKYYAHHAAIEEVTTEVLARDIMGMDPKFGPYQTVIDSTLTLLAKHTKEDPRALLIEAAKRYKATPYHPGSPLATVFAEAVSTVDPTIDVGNLLHDLTPLRARE